MFKTILLRLVLRRVLVLAVVASAVLSLQAVAQNSLIAQQNGAPQQNPAQQQVETAISQRRALEMVRASFPGNVVSINQVQRQGGVFYRVRMDDGGNIFTVYVNANSGEITREQ